MKVPHVFISYSHDSSEHKQWVMKLAAELMEKGIDVALDQWALKPGSDLPHFMESNLAAADKVLMVCTEKYVAKANSGKGGVGYEKMIVTADLMKDIQDSKVIPLVRQTATSDLPTFLRSKLYLNFSDRTYEFSFDELVRTLHDAPLFVKPPLGQRPEFSKVAEPTPPAPETTGDPILIVMGLVVQMLEKDPQEVYIRYSSLVYLGQEFGMSRLYLDHLLDVIQAKGYLITPTNGFLTITQKGRAFAMANKLDGRK